MSKLGLAAFMALIAIQGSGVEAQQNYQVILRGGYLHNEFQSCGTVACGASSYCCRFTNSYRTNEQSYFCLNDYQTSGYSIGYYQDQENYPFERYDWNCGDQKRYSTNWNYQYGVLLNSQIPVELVNNEFWQWTWLILFTFVVSGGGWLFGYFIYVPMTALLAAYNFTVVVYSTTIMLFERPQRLTFQQWILYPVRRWFVQNIIVTLGFFWTAIPGISAFVLPILGLWYVNDFLDYQGWDQLSATVGIPFNGTRQSNTNTYQDPYNNSVERYDYDNNWSYNYDPQPSSA